MQGKREGQEGDNPKFFGKKCIALLFGERLPLPFPRPPLGGSRQARLKMLLLLGPLFRKPCSGNSKPRGLVPWAWEGSEAASRGKRLLAKGSTRFALPALLWLGSCVSTPYLLMPSFRYCSPLIPRISSLGAVMLGGCSAHYVVLPSAVLTLVVIHSQLFKHLTLRFDTTKLNTLCSTTPQVERLRSEAL